MEIGDVIRINRIGYQHVGVYVGPSWFDRCDVVHNRKNGGVELTTLAEFSSGRQVFIHQKAVGDGKERQQIAQRARQLVGKKYDLLTFNCEHAANLAQRGKAESPQITFAFFALLAIAGLFFFGEEKG
ncbi:MAG: lecithin retinol acyltransferase family protein [Patescibacteria group bacterium]|nr:lecithin retinol acyltransferase family protein [Patescibacteria group bacterium]